MLVPRLAAAGADLDRFMFVDIPAGGTFSLGVDLDALTSALDGHDVALIVVDPLDSHLGSIDSHKKAEVQSTVARLAETSQQLRCGVVGLAHFNKAAVTDLLTKVVGSVGFTTSIRSVLAVGEHPEDPTERVCAVGKANMVDRFQVPAVRFRAVPSPIPAPDGGIQIDTAKVEILGEIDGFDSNSLITGPQERLERSALDEAADWLRSQLADGPRRKADLRDEAEVRNISHATLKRAANQLGVVVERDESTQGRPSTWHLNGYGSTVTAQDDMSRNQQRSVKGNSTNQRVAAQHIWMSRNIRRRPARAHDDPGAGLDRERSRLPGREAIHSEPDRRHDSFRCVACRSSRRPRCAPATVGVAGAVASPCFRDGWRVTDDETTAVVRALARVIARADAADQPTLRRAAGQIVDAPGPEHRLCWRCEADISTGCHGCGRELTGRQRRWCSDRCRRQARP